MRLDELAARLGDEIEIRWKSFMLRPAPEDRPREKFVHYTKSWARPDEAEPAAEFVEWASDDDPPSHSLPALVAAKVVERLGDEGASHRFHRNLMKAYFTDNRTISSREVLLDIAIDSGVDEAKFATGFDEDGGELAQVVIDEHNEAINKGINAVPTVVVDDVIAVPGAQDVDTYANLIERIRTRRAEGKI